MFFSRKWRKLHLVLFTGKKKTKTKERKDMLGEELFWETRMYLQRLKQKWALKRTILILKALYLTLLAILHNTDNLLDSLGLFHKGNLQTKPALGKQLPVPPLAQLFISLSTGSSTRTLNRSVKSYELTFNERLNHFLVSHLTGSEEWGVFHDIQSIHLCFMLQQQLHCADVARKGSSVQCCKEK